MTPHILERVRSLIVARPLAVTPQKLDAILGAIGVRIGLDATLPLVLQSNGTSRREAPIAPAGIAIIEIVGTLMKRVGPMEADSGLVSYGAIREALQSALANPQVGAILLQIASDGGEAEGVFDLADEIFAARKHKPIWAIADERAYSAAYALAAAAERVIVPRTGGVGSIGVIAAHVDVSAADEQAGLKYTIVSAGAHKSELSPHGPLSEAARTDVQAEVDRVHAIFTQSVARYRGLGVAAVRAQEAATFHGPHAVAAGLADDIGTLDATVKALSHELRSNVQPSRMAAGKDKGGITMKADETQNAAGGPGNPDPPPAPEPAPKPQAGTNVVSIDAARAEGRTQAIAHMRSIQAVCALAGQPDRVDEFLDKGLTADQVALALQRERAESSDALGIRSSIAPSTAPASGRSPARAAEGLIALCRERADLMLKGVSHGSR